MEQRIFSPEALQLKLTLAAAPVLNITRPDGFSPEPVTPEGATGFVLGVETNLQYNYLGRVLNTLVSGKRMEISEGFFSSYVVVQEIAVAADGGGNLLIRVNFGGSFGGTVYLSGKPVYVPASQHIVVQGLSYDLKSKSLLLNTGKLLFNKKIIAELEKYAVIPIGDHLQQIREAVAQMLNKEWKPGISSAGSLSDLELTGITALPQHIKINAQCTGKFSVNLDLSLLQPT